MRYAIALKGLNCTPKKQENDINVCIILNNAIYCKFTITLY